MGIFCDDLQKFARFKSAVELATKSSSGEKVETLSDQLESVLFTFTSLMRRVVSRMTSVAVLKSQYKKVTHCVTNI